MSGTSPLGLATTYLLLLPFIVRYCTVYSYLPFCVRTYSPGRDLGRYQLLPGTVPKFDKRSLVKAYVKDMRVVP
jgi:hypothetical protein